MPARHPDSSRRRRGDAVRHQEHVGRRRLAQLAARVQDERLVGARGAGLGQRGHALGQGDGLHPRQRAVLVAPQPRRHGGRRRRPRRQRQRHDEHGRRAVAAHRPGGPGPLVTVMRMRASRRPLASTTACAACASPPRAAARCPSCGSRPRAGARCASSANGRPRTSAGSRTRRRRPASRGRPERCTPRSPRRARRSARSSRSERQRLAAGLHRPAGGPQQPRRLVHRLLPLPGGSESAVTAPPTCRCSAPRAATSVRIATDSSSSSPGPNHPIAPQYGPRRTGSSSSMISSALILGAPVTEPGGKVARITSAADTPGRVGAVDGRDQVVHARV